MKNYVDNGTTLNYTNAAAATVLSGQIIRIGNILGAALVDIPQNETGAVQIRGKVIAPKVSAAVFAQGEKLNFDISVNGGKGAFDDAASAPAAGDVYGGAVAAEAGTNGQTECVVIFTPGNTEVI